MKQITLRGVPRDIESLIRKEAERKGLSLNRAFISVLERAAGRKVKAQKTKSSHHDLDHLCGAWTKREAEQFTETLEFERKIDEELWKHEKS